jgi:hypothetical protein
LIAHRLLVTLTPGQSVTVHVPHDFPSGNAEIVVLSLSAPSPDDPESLDVWLDRLLAAIPPAPVVELSSLDRGELYR